MGLIVLFFGYKRADSVTQILFFNVLPNWSPEF